VTAGLIILDQAHDANVLFQLRLRKDSVLLLCSTWQADVRGIPTDDNVGESWGPTQDQIDDMAMRAVVGSWDNGLRERWPSQTAESDDDDDEVMVGDDDDLVDAVELAAFVDAYHCDDDPDWLSDE
jgi:hypothetical protein